MNDERYRSAGSDVLRVLKDHLRSWRHSADPAAMRAEAKVIGGRFG